jgi:hypothetical protein
MAFTLQSMVLLHLDSRQAPPYKSLGEARGLRLGPECKTTSTKQINLKPPKIKSEILCCK